MMIKYETQLKHKLIISQRNVNNTWREWAIDITCCKIKITLHMTTQSNFATDNRM